MAASRHNPENRAAYKRRYLSDPVNYARHKATQDRRRALNSEFRKNLLSQFSCLLCDESDSDLIDWHHVFPEEKLFEISKLQKSHEAWWNEVLKCIPLCALCHRKIHTNKLCLIPPKLR